MTYHLHNDVAAFHNKFDLVYVGTYRKLDPELRSFRDKFLLEELREYTSSLALVVHELRLPVEMRDPGEYVVGLEGMLDALVDLAYVAIGTCYLRGVVVEDPKHLWSPRKSLQVGAPRFGDLRELEQRLYMSVLQFTNEYNDKASAVRASQFLMGVIAANCAFYNFPFVEAWRRVQLANMSKVRATSADQSKRGSTFDVVKPPGWEPPSHTDLVEINNLWSHQR